MLLHFSDKAWQQWYHCSTFDNKYRHLNVSTSSVMLKVAQHNYTDWKIGKEIRPSANSGAMSTTGMWGCTFKQTIMQICYNLIHFKTGSNWKQSVIYITGWLTAELAVLSRGLNFASAPTKIPTANSGCSGEWPKASTGLTCQASQIQGGRGHLQSGPTATREWQINAMILHMNKASSILDVLNNTLISSAG